jgi:hypothetical protein
MGDGSGCLLGDLALHHQQTSTTLREQQQQQQHAQRRTTHHFFAQTLQSLCPLQIPQ